MSDLDDSEPDVDDESEPDDFEPGMLKAFIGSMNPETRKLWPAIHRVFKRKIARLRSADPTRDRRDDLYAAFQTVQGKITAAKLESLVNNAVEKGDAQTLRVLALMAGIDLTERPPQQTGEGAKVIIIKPHPKEIAAQGAITDGA